MNTLTNCAEKKAKQFFNLLQGYTKGIRITAILILLLMGVSNAWGGDRIYLKPNSNWTNDGARFAAYFFGNGEKWVSMTCYRDFYSVEVPTGFTKVIFCRMDPSAAANNWNNKWNQSGDLTIPTDGNNLFTVPSGSWDGSTTTWSKHTPADQVVYLKPTDQWNKDGARFAAYAFNGCDNKWIDLYEIGCAGEYYTCTIPDKYHQVIFGRMAPNGTNGWTENTQIWNKSGDLTIDKGKCYTISSTGNGTGTAASGSWGTYTASTYSITKPATTTGGTINLSKSSDIALNEQVTVTITTSEGYTYKSGTITIGTNAAENISVGTSTHIICGPTTITAQWTANQYDVTLDQQGGTDGTTSVQATIGQAMPAATMPKRTGYTFGGYYTDTNGGGTQYYNANGGSAQNWDIASETTLYAQWTPINYTITYNTNGGSGTMTPTSYTIETATFNLPTPIKTGYTFDGWYTKSDFSDAKVTQIVKGTTGNKTLYAKWTANTNTAYTVKHYKQLLDDTYSATPDETENLTGTTDASVTPAVKSYTGFTAPSAQTVTIKADGSTVVTYYYTRNKHTLTWNLDGGDITGAGTAAGEVAYGATLTAPTVEKDGYRFTGWSPAVPETMPDNDVTCTAQWTANTYTVTLQHSTIAGCGSDGTSSVTATYNADMPSATMPTAANGYVFKGYFDGEQGAGTKYYNADGASAHVWDKTDNATLYAHFVKVEITAITLDKSTFEPVEAGGEGYVTATPTLEPTPTNDVVLCWRLLYNSGNPVAGRDAQEVSGNSVQFSIAGLAAGTYKIEAVLRTGSNCGSGEVLSTKTVNFSIASSYTITVRYTCDGKEIAAPAKVSARVTEETGIKAPDITGYTFSSWEAGDGVTIESIIGDSVNITAIYDGYLTAKYEKRKLIFLDLSTLKTKANWTAPHIYLYKGAKNENTGGYWNDQTGAGGKTGGNYITHAAMTKVPSTENIWYFDYEQYTNNFNVFVAFTSNNQGNATHFANCEAIYRTEFSSGTPVFVPESNQTAETKNSTAKYYSKGYWVKYMDGTGYWLIIYNAEGNKELVRREFTSETQRMTMTSIVDLEAEHTYKYEIYRNDGYYYNGGDITYTNSSNYKPLNEAEKHTIKTTETGNYTFTLDYFTGDLQIKVQYPVEVGDYRILYTDDVRAGKYKPSQVISQNNKEPLVSFFVRPNDNPVLKIQKAMLVTEYEVIWDNVLYLAPDGSWKSDGARFAAYFYNNSGSTWVSMTSINNGEYYGCAIPEGNWSNVIFCRMNPNNHENRWNQDSDGDNKPVWNQTINLTIGQNNQFTITNPWDNNHDKKATGTWSKRNDIIDLSDALNDKLRELGLTNIKENEGTVFNIHLSNNSGTPMIEKVALYTGNYYIRVDAVDGMWYDYKTNPDNLMTYSAFSESDANSFGEKFSHYKTKWCPRGTNVKFVIANDYSLCISDTITRDLSKASGVGGEDYMTEGGDLYQEDGGTKDPVYDRYSANIRFMWNRKTNKISRAYLASSSNDSRQFLVLKGCQEIKDENGNNLSGNGDNHNEFRALLQDTQDWIYERTFMVQPGTRVKLYACYANAVVDPAKAQYFRGAYDSNQCGSAENSVQILGGSDKTKWEKIRVIYDFKTNRLIGAWVPSDEEISETQTIAADVMIMRNHQDEATCITLAEGKSLDSVKTVYGTMRFNRWTLNNRGGADDHDITNSTVEGAGGHRVYDENITNLHHPVLSLAEQKSIYERGLYFISFPFDVHLSDVFGFGTYGTHWVISTYNGKRRAERGYFAEDCINEDCTNWDYIWDPSGFVMKANEGYLLSLDLDLMKHDNTSFWANNISQVELFFPSQVELETITKTDYTMPELGPEHECKINLNTTGKEPEKDRTVKDSYWRCIGVPSFADYSALLKDGSDESITWQPAGGNLPFLYEWNVTNNNLEVRSATNYRFRPTFAYLIQNGSEINWEAVNTKPASIIARDQTEKVSNFEWKIALLRNDAPADHTFIRMTDNESVTSAFDFHQDLSKEFNYGANIYTLVGYERLAANSLPMSDSTTIIPLGVSAQEAGDYTITMPEGVENIGITLVDNETGIHTNLSAGQEYTLTLNNGICENRLFIEVSPIQNTPTDLEYTTEDTREQTTRKMLIDGILYLIRDGVIYDAQGHKL